uniref:Outer membrane protein beta-barrel domain-containing protein n=1 Tax=candidate division WOR-3 bacterium TaxID=2052148 RepID=A0A7C4XFH2_UNCW3
MKRTIPLTLFLLLFAQAKGVKRFTHSNVEIAPKASLYIGEDAYFGIGAEGVVNPVRQIGIRLNITEIIFGNGTHFYLNSGNWSLSGLSLDGLFYIPMAEMEPYVHSGLGFEIFNPPGGGGIHTFFSFRFGMGLSYPVNPKTKVFVEPGIIIYDAGNTETVFRLSFGARFGIL